MSYICTASSNSKAAGCDLVPGTGNTQGTLIYIDPTPAQKEKILKEARISSIFHDPKGQFWDNSMPPGILFSVQDFYVCSRSVDPLQDANVSEPGNSKCSGSPLIEDPSLIRRLKNYIGVGDDPYIFAQDYGLGRTAPSNDGRWEEIKVSWATKDWDPDAPGRDYSSGAWIWMGVGNPSEKNWTDLGKKYKKPNACGSVPGGNPRIAVCINQLLTSNEALDFDTTRGLLGWEMNSVISSKALVPDRLWGPTSYSGETTTRIDPDNFVSVTTYRPKFGIFSTIEVEFLKEIHGYKTCLIQGLDVMNKLLCSYREFTIRPSDGATIITPIIPVPERAVPTGVGLDGVEAPTTPGINPRGEEETPKPPVVVKAPTLTPPPVILPKPVEPPSPDTPGPRRPRD